MRTNNVYKKSENMQNILRRIIIAEYTATFVYQ